MFNSEELEDDEDSTESMEQKWHGQVKQATGVGASEGVEAEDSDDEEELNDAVGEAAAAARGREAGGGPRMDVIAGGGDKRNAKAIVKGNFDAGTKFKSDASNFS